jgi:hypothetical protein
MEEWIPIPGYEEYEVSTYGNVRHGDKVLKRRLDTRGYPYVGLYHNPKQRNFTIHRLVAMMFIMNPDNLPQVDHIDRNKNNNHVSNLRWVSCELNMSNRGVMSNNKLGEKNISKAKYGYRVCIQRNSINTEKTFKTLEEARAFRDSFLL